jgi:quinol-cytochrome oxidoreductase complex cytochrome b subunit
MSLFRRRLLEWFQERLNLTEIFSFITTFGLAYGDIDTRKPLAEAIKDAFKKPLPAYAQWPYVLGILSFVLFLFQVGTGMLLAFYYQPVPEDAYASVLLVIRDLPLGWYIHQMHHWGSHILLALLALRLARFFVHGTYKAPRELLWIFGVVLLFLAVHAALTGSLLPWDQKAYWSTTRSLEIIRDLPLLGPLFSFFMGQLEVQSNTLTRFYILHAILIPLFTFAFFYLHFATVRRIGLSPLAEGRPLDPKPLFPDHLLNLLVILLLLFGAILTLAVLAPAVFEEQADPFSSPQGVHPPWYFLPAYGLRELLPPWMAGIILLLALVAFVLVPFLDRTPDRPLSRRPLALLFFAATCLALVLLGYLGYTLRG